MNDYLTISDQLHRKAMQDGSRKLLEAIRWARKGYNPGTAEEPMKLPPDWTNKCAPPPTGKRRSETVPCSEQIREMMERDMTVGEIAKAVNHSHQKVGAIMKAIKLQRRRNDFEERLHQKLWG
jgi:hypothetical protein